MANDLTGDFDVVAEFSLGAADRILAAMHCGGRLPHSWSLRVDDFVHFKFPLNLKNLATGIRSVSDTFGNAVPNPGVVAKVSVSSPLICTSALLNPNQDSPVNFPTAAVGSAAIATHFSPDIIDRFGVGGLLTPGAAERASHLVGVAQLQMGAPTITLIENSDSAVVVHTPVRARYTADPDTLYIPDFLRGEFQTSITVKNVSSPAGAAIEVLLAGKSGNVNFVPNWVSPAWDSEPAQLTAINKALVNSLQSSFEPSTTPLPGNSILNLKFKTLADGPALAMLMDLPGGNPSGPPDPASVNNVFLADDDDFAFAISDEFVQAMISRSVTDLRAQRHSFTVTGRITIIPNPFGDDVTASVSATYTVTVNSVTVALQDAGPGFSNGRIVVTIQGSANTDSVWPDVNFTATQNLGLELISSALDSTADLIVLGDPSVDLHAPGITPDWIIKPLKPNAVNVIKTNIAGFLAEINPGLRQRLSVKANLGDFLNSLMNPPAKPGVSVTPLNSQLAYTSFEIFTSGIVLHGTLAVPPWPKAHTDFTFYTVGGFGPMPFARGEYNALNSWIPGGTIKEHIWNQQDGPTLRDDHGTFIFLQKNPDGLVHLCLTIKGTRISASGPITYDPVVAASFCSWHSHITVKGAVIELAAHGRKPPKIALTQAAAHGGLQVVGHTSPWAPPGTSPQYTANLIVHFPSQHSVSDLNFLIRAVNESGRADTATAIIVALSHAQLHLAKPTPGIIFSDDEKAWAHLLGMKEAPATFVIGTTGEVVWHHQGAVTADQLASALKKHLSPNAHFLPRALESSLRIGQPVPNFLFESAPGHANTLRKLAGRSAVLVFWSSASRASIETVLDLQKAFDGAPDTAPVILAINDDDTPEVAHKLAAENGLKSVLVVPDPARDIALAYGITIWPTTIFLDESGLVAGIRQGRFKQELATQPSSAEARAK